MRSSYSQKVTFSDRENSQSLCYYEITTKFNRVPGKMQEAFTEDYDQHQASNLDQQFL